jgi:hypothetical protein
MDVHARHGAGDAQGAVAGGAIGGIAVIRVEPRILRIDARERSCGVPLREPGFATRQRGIQHFDAELIVAARRRRRWRRGRRRREDADFRQAVPVVDAVAMAQVTDIPRLHVWEVVGLFLRGRAAALGAPDRGPGGAVAGCLDVEHVAALIALVHGKAQVGVTST